MDDVEMSNVAHAAATYIKSDVAHDDLLGYNNILKYGEASHQMDDDGERASSSSSAWRTDCVHRHNKKNRRRRKPYARNKAPCSIQQQPPAPSNRQRFHWTIVKFIYGERLGLETIFEEIKNKLNLTFKPVAVRVKNRHIAFFTYDLETSKNRNRLNNFVVKRDGLEISIQAKPAPAPEAKITPESVNKIKKVMIGRYDCEAESLDLSAFWSEPLLLELGFYQLTRDYVVKVVLDHIQKYMPNIVALNLSDNHIRQLDIYKDLRFKVPQLKSLNLSGNLLSTNSDFVKLVGLEIDNIIMEDNPINFTMARPEIENYLRSFIPQLKTINGLPVSNAFVGLAHAECGVIPKTKGSFLSDDVCRKSEIFLREYLKLFDAETRPLRSALTSAYHENAVFSISTCNIPQESYGKGRVRTRTLPQNARYEDLETYSHWSCNNLIDNVDKCWENMFRGRQSIEDFLRTFPSTLHDPSSIVIDSISLNPALLFCCVSGVYREYTPNEKIRNQPVRAFRRTCTLVPHESTFFITNEQLFITKPTLEQLRAAFSEEREQELQETSQAVNSIKKVYPRHFRREMMLSFALKTGMNRQYSLKCLEDNDWDNNKAFNSFEFLKKRGVIPPEAFQKSVHEVESEQKFSNFFCPGVTSGVSDSTNSAELNVFAAVKVKSEKWDVKSVKTDIG